MFKLRLSFLQLEVSNKRAFKLPFTNLKSCFFFWFFLCIFLSIFLPPCLWCNADGHIVNIVLVRSVLLLNSQFWKASSSWWGLLQEYEEQLYRTSCFIYYKCCWSCLTSSDLFFTCSMHFGSRCSCARNPCSVFLQGWQLSLSVVSLCCARLFVQYVLVFSPDIGGRAQQCQVVKFCFRWPVFLKGPKELKT